MGTRETIAALGRNERRFRREDNARAQARLIGLPQPFLGHHPKCSMRVDGSACSGDLCINYAIARHARKTAVARRRRVKGW